VDPRDGRIDQTAGQHLSDVIDDGVEIAEVLCDG
jgi:hypothetical protein